MGNKLISLFIFCFLNLAVSRGADLFPLGCPGNKLEKSCEALASIPTDKVLVFADGTEMPACYLTTANPKLSDEKTKKSMELHRIIVNKLDKILTRDQVMNLVYTLSEPSALLPYFKSDPEGQKAVEELIQLEEAERPPKRRTNKDIQESFDYAQTEMAKEVEKGNFANPTLKNKTISQVKSIKNAPVQSIRAISCKPVIQAFYLWVKGTSVQALSLTPATTQMPEFSKLRIIGHELAHSFDPCKPELQDSHPFKKLIDCLQKDVGEFKEGYFNYKNDSHTCEAFADMFGVYIAEKWQKSQPPAKPIVRDSSPNKIYMPPGYEMIIVDLDLACRDLASHYKGEGSHPASETRLKEIILKNPTVAKAVNCPMDAKTPRCDIEEGFKGEKEPGFFMNLYNKIKNYR